MKNIVLIIGARPNFMKAFPVYEALKNDFNLTLIHTGQHFDKKMSKVFFEQLKFPYPDIHLTLDKRTKAGDFDDKLYQNNLEYLKNKDKVIEDLINYKGELGQMGEIRDKLKKEFEHLKPDLVIVFGDVTSTLAAGLASKILDIDIAHVESGLRSNDIRMPEEVNRILTDHITKYYFVTEQSGVDNLNASGITENIYLVGNTMIDTQKKYLQQALDTKYHETLVVKAKEYILITLHRPSNVDDINKLKEIFDDLSELSKTNKLVYPIHPRTKKNLKKIGYLEKVENNKNIILQDPLGYLEFTCLMANCKYVVTDSGGLQEESTALDIPCFTLRENTERPSTLFENHGTNQMISKISEIELKECKSSMDLWDGKSSERILFIIQKIIYNDKTNSYNLKIIQTGKFNHLNISGRILNEVERQIKDIEVPNKVNTKNELSIINIYLNYEDEIEFHNNISELLKLISIYPEYEDYIYMEIGKLYKNFMKSYSIISLHYFGKAIRIRNGKCNYDSKLCFYYENCIYSLNKERALLKITCTNSNDIKLFYESMYKYVNNIDSFEEELKLFIKSGKKIYQSIPLQSYTFKDEIIIKKNTIEEYKLEEILLKDMNLIITSCDINYFNLYGKYIIESFLKNNDNEILIVDVINNNQILSSIKDIINNYNKNKNIIIKIKNVNVKNIKAYSSTLRFIRAYYLKNNKCLIIDVDSVILKPLGNLFTDMDKYDIGSRILEKTYPWQMYTAGFCFFNNTTNSNKVLTDMYNCLNNKMDFNTELWWIDQNVLEYGIRNNKNILSIKNYFGIKDKYIISPTGNTEHKLKTLKNLI